MTVIQRPFPFLRARTKIVATVGPACREEAQLAALVRAGVDVFRLNMAHENREQHDATLGLIRVVSRELHQPLGVLVDLGGPKLRLGELASGELHCREGDALRLVRGDVAHQPDELVATYPTLVEELRPGDRMLLADGTLSLIVESRDLDAVHLRAQESGHIRSRQGIHLPGARLRTSALTEKDLEDARWAARRGIDFVGLSFVRSATEVETLRDLLREHRPDGSDVVATPQVVAKIEKKEALDDLDSIVRAADAVMVARGDLGVEIDVARLAVEQKRIIATCNRYLKPVITATQMLSSMQHHSHPTRAEATDVANAILDGTDACMLSEETAVGENPEAAVQMMNRIGLATEPLLRDRPPPPLAERMPDELKEVTRVLVHAAADVAAQLRARLVLVASHSGVTALTLSKRRPFVDVIGVSDEPATLRRMCLYWGVTPLPGAQTGDGAALLDACERWGCEQDGLDPEDRVILVASTHWTRSSHDTIVVHEVAVADGAEHPHE